MKRLKEVFDKYFTGICVGLLVTVGGAAFDYVKNYWELPSRVKILEERMKANDSLDTMQKDFLIQDWKILQDNGLTPKLGK